MASVCSGGTVKQAGDYTFCYGPPGQTQPEAKAFCAARGLQLVAPKTEPYAAAVSEVCGDGSGTNCTWIALECPEGADCTSHADWAFPDGSAVAASLAAKVRMPL